MTRIVKFSLNSFAPFCSLFRHWMIPWFAQVVGGWLGVIACISCYQPKVNIEIFSFRIEESTKFFLSWITLVFAVVGSSASLSSSSSPGESGLWSIKSGIGSSFLGQQSTLASLHHHQLDQRPVQCLLASLPFLHWHRLCQKDCLHHHCCCLWL